MTIRGQLNDIVADINGKGDGGEVREGEDLIEKTTKKGTNFNRRGNTERPRRKR